MLDVDYEGDVKKMGRDAVSVDAQGKRLSIPDLTMSKLGQDIGAMVEDITKKLYDPILEKGELTRNEYKNALIGIASEIIRTENFDPTKQSLDKFVSSRLYLRANALAKQLGVPQEFLKDIANITDPTVDPDDDVDTKDEPVTKARVLNNFDIELEDGLVDAEIIAEVEALIEENPADLEARMERLILNDIRKKLDKTVGKIAKNKQTGKREPTPEYEVFIRNEYEEIVQSLGIKTIRTAYKTWFTQEKTGVKKYKNIREDGSVSNYVKATQINSTNKREYIRWFLEGKPGSLTERRTALLRRIARKKAEIAIDDYIERNSSNLDAVIDAKLRSLTRTAENIADEQASFDSIKFSENTKKKLKVYRLQTKKAADGSGRIIPRFQTAGHALEQVIIDQLVEWGWNLDLLDVEFMHTTNRGGLIDVILNVTDINTGKSRAVNMEVKMNKKVRMSSVLVSDYNLNYGDEQSFNLANDVYSDLSPYAEMLVNARESIMNLRNAYNRKIDAYNRKHGTKEPYLKYGGRMVDKIYHDPEIAKLRAAVRKNSYVFDDATPLIEHNLAKNVEIIEIFGMGLYSFEKNSSLTNPITGIGPKYIGETTAKVRAALGVKNTGRKRKQVEGVKTIIRNKAGDAYIDFRLQFQNTLINFKSTKENKSPISITNQQDVIGMFGIKQSQSGSLPFAAMKASENAKTPKKYHEQSRGMSTFDFDETLIIDGENFIVAKDPITGEKIKISSADWPIQGPRLAEQGYTFDFSDFVNVRGGVDGPLLQKMKNQIKKYGAKNVFVLTARPQSSAVAIHSWLKSKKINIPLENITGLGNSTGAAKAEWMLKKFAQGYNDMYFVDDALPNVEAVKDVLDQLDIKSNVQQARIKFSESLGVEFNKIIQQVTGIQAVIRFSDIQAKLRGAKTKYKSIVPPSAQDFVGLLYSFLGKGKQGEQQMEFFKKALLDPFNRGIDSLNASKRIAAVDYEKLLKKFPDVKKLLTKKIEGTPFTYDQAIRVYLWNKNGFSVPGLSIRDLNMLTSVIKNDPSLMEFAENIGFISKREEGYAAPTEYWLVENINSDLLSDGAIGDVRSKFLAEWIENKNAIFSPENLNKIEAIYGSKFREALEDMLFRMETGRSRPVGGGRIMNMYTNWVNNSVGAIMFFNIRSAVLQTISATNYINWSDNNILAAATAFANQKQYWADFVMLFNSNYLKQR
jgi:ribosomal protein S11